MKGYGLPRVIDLECPDLLDIQNYGLKSSKSRVVRNGTIKNSFRNSKLKRDTRRIWKKKARAAQKGELRQLERDSIE
jgi:hypothetical protein